MIKQQRYTIRPRGKINKFNANITQVSYQQIQQQKKNINILLTNRHISSHRGIK